MPKAIVSGRMGCTRRGAYSQKPRCRIASSAPSAIQSAQKLLYDVAMVQIAFPALVAVVGLVAYAISSNAKVSELGRIAFFCGLFVVCWVLAQARIHL